MLLQFQVLEIPKSKMSLCPLMLNKIFSSDSESSPVNITFNLTNGNSEDLLSPLPSITLGANDSLTIDVIPLGAGHVDIAAWPIGEGSKNVR